jgi:hypothetical protein
VGGFRKENVDPFISSIDKYNVKMLHNRNTMLNGLQHNITNQTTKAHGTRLVPFKVKNSEPATKIVQVRPNLIRLVYDETIDPSGYAIDGACLGLHKLNKITSHFDIIMVRISAALFHS